MCVYIYIYIYIIYIFLSIYISYTYAYTQLNRSKGEACKGASEPAAAVGKFASGGCRLLEASAASLLGAMHTFSDSLTWTPQAVRKLKISVIVNP